MSKLKRVKLPFEERGTIAINKLDVARINEICDDLRIGQHQVVQLLLECWGEYGDRILARFDQDAA